jgi:hypothetical protein
MFLEIADDVHEEREIQKLLALTGNLPLAIDIIAHLADYEGCPQVLERWETEKISLLSDGHDKRSNLEVSLQLSLSSPRMESAQDAKTLLSLLSLLPDGLSDVELTQSKLPLRDPLSCKAALLRTSLAYLDHDHRLKALVPIREYMGSVHPPSYALVYALLQYFQTLLQLYRRYLGLELGQVIHQIAPNIGNLQSIILHGLTLKNEGLSDTCRCALDLNSFHRLSGRDSAISMNNLFEIVQQLDDGQLKVLHITETFASWSRHPIPNPAGLIEEVEQYFTTVHDPKTECEFRFIGASPQLNTFKL